MTNENILSGFRPPEDACTSKQLVSGQIGYGFDKQCFPCLAVPALRRVCQKGLSNKRFLLSQPSLSY